MPTMTTSHVGSLSSSVACLHLHDDDDDNPPPRLQLRDGVGFFHLFFQVNERRRRRRAIGSLSSSAACLCLHDDDDDEPCRLVVVICLHLHPRQPNNPPPRLQLRDGVGFLHPFF